MQLCTAIVPVVVVGCCWLLLLLVVVLVVLVPQNCPYSSFQVHSMRSNKSITPNVPQGLRCVKSRPLVICGLRTYSTQFLTFPAKLSTDIQSMGRHLLHLTDSTEKTSHCHRWPKHSKLQHRRFHRDETDWNVKCVWHLKTTSSSSISFYINPTTVRF
jgi:hypothetical protein